MDLRLSKNLTVGMTGYRSHCSCFVYSLWFQHCATFGIRFLSGTFPSSTLPYRCISSVQQRCPDFGSVFTGVTRLWFTCCSMGIPLELCTRCHFKQAVCSVGIRRNCAFTCIVFPALCWPALIYRTNNVRSLDCLASDGDKISSSSFCVNIKNYWNEMLNCIIVRKKIDSRLEFASICKHIQSCEVCKQHCNSCTSSE